MLSMNSNSLRLRNISKVKPVEATITVLLRSDIFAFIQHILPEQDKLPIVQVTWNDQELLLRVVEERMLYDAPRERTASAVWEGMFPSTTTTSCLVGWLDR